jgi:glycogen debranching enzyme
LNEGYEKAVGLLRECSTPHGFVASPERKDNYRRVWGRDGVIAGLAALQTGDESLTSTFRATLLTLALRQGAHGEIPSNVDAEKGEISYGGTTGRVDADLWFGIGVGQYFRATGDAEFLAEIAPALDRVHFLLGAWEFNGRGLLYVPQTGDWSDEFIQNGYVLYDQLLYLQFQRELAMVDEALGRERSAARTEKRRRLERMIRANFWFERDDEVPEDVYHEVLYTKGKRAAEHCAERHWMPFFSPLGYGYRIDTLANVLVSALGVADARQIERVDARIEEIAHDEAALLPAFHPVIEPWDEDWEDLQTMFSYSFKNQPYEFHNGGLWPMVTGFYVADLAARGRVEPARRYLDGIDRANALEDDEGEWCFPEYVHGRKLTPGGTRKLAWSAAASVMGHHALAGAPLFREDRR